MSKTYFIIGTIVVLAVAGIGGWAMYAPIDPPRAPKIIQQTPTSKTARAPEAAPPKSPPPNRTGKARPATPTVAPPKTTRKRSNQPPPLARSIEVPRAPAPQIAAVRQIPKTPIPVDSYAPSHIHPLSEWQARKGIYGFVDTVHVIGERPRVFDWTPVNDNDVLVITGWAGVKEFGMRMRHVLLSVCGNVVGSVEVDGARPDIAKQMHPNLGKAGWAAHLAVTHLPRCADARVKAWGIGPKGAVVWPLNREIEIKRDDNVTKKAKFIAHTSPVRASQRGVYPRQRFRITASTLNLRRCASGKCAVVQKLSAGTYTGLVLQRGKQWSLVALDKGAGWLANRYVKISALPKKPSPRAVAAPPPSSTTKQEVGGYISQAP